MKKNFIDCPILLIILGGILVGAAAPSPPQTTSQTTPIQQASDEQITTWVNEVIQVANQYVSTLDKGLYADSWTQGSTIFQHTINQREWKIALGLARRRLGNVKSRTIKDVRIAWNPAGLPKGPYMVVEYETAFDKAPHSGETLTFNQDSSGKWKVLTYQVN